MINKLISKLPPKRRVVAFLGTILLSLNFLAMTPYSIVSLPEGYVIDDSFNFSYSVGDMSLESLQGVEYMNPSFPEPSSSKYLQILTYEFNSLESQQQIIAYTINLPEDISDINLVAVDGLSMFGTGWNRLYILDKDNNPINCTVSRNRSFRNSNCLVPSVPVIDGYSEKEENMIRYPNSKCDYSKNYGYRIYSNIPGIGIEKEKPSFDNIPKNSMVIVSPESERTFEYVSGLSKWFPIEVIGKINFEDYNDSKPITKFSDELRDSFSVAIDDNNVGDVEVTNIQFLGSHEDWKKDGYINFKLNAKIPITRFDDLYSKTVKMHVGANFLLVDKSGIINSYYYRWITSPKCTYTFMFAKDTNGDGIDDNTGKPMPPYAGDVGLGEGNNNLPPDDDASILDWIKYIVMFPINLIKDILTFFGEVVSSIGQGLTEFNAFMSSFLGFLPSELRYLIYGLFGFGVIYGFFKIIRGN